ncbi:MAG: DUF1848 domain-containing protein [Thermodesulfobacteriota bacterium]|nr:DUF1848 domain-containing protein [Thermodesulfobacteriota bacterium]
MKTVISASRRTDIPAFYMDWFMAGIKEGTFEVVNPYNRTVRQVPAGPDEVHTIVFWSKNFGSFLDMGYGETLVRRGYHLFFNFTVNSKDRLLEPNLPPLDVRLSQLAEIARRFGPERIHWRFDPICFYTTANGDLANNLKDFSAIADAAAEAGIRRCITSFMDNYAKTKNRTAHMPDVTFVSPDPEKQVHIINRMASQLENRGMALHTCCEKALTEALPATSSVTPSACIPNTLFMELDGGEISTRKDTGQRVAQGCGCKVSIDIGSYDKHPCFHNCLFCYANPQTPPSY